MCIYGIVRIIHADFILCYNGKFAELESKISIFVGYGNVFVVELAFLNAITSCLFITWELGVWAVGMGVIAVVWRHYS